MGQRPHEILITGIDPGLSGAVSKLWIDLTNKDILDYTVTDAPTISISGTSKREYNIVAMNQIISDISKDDAKLKFVYLEKQHAMPAQGVVSVFGLGYGYGLWRALLVSNGLNTNLITPQSWKKKVMAGMSKEKSQSVVRAQELFPKAVLTTPRGKALDGRGDAMLIGYYGYQEFHL